jgi:hypothetical protein
MRKKDWVRISAIGFALSVSGCVQKMPADAGVKIYESISAKRIPEGVQPEPNLATLQHYLPIELSGRFRQDSIGSTPSSNPLEIETNLQKSKFLDGELNSSGLISYLFYEDGKLIYDELSPYKRLGQFVDNSTPLKSNSIAKSWTSYLLAHAMCNGILNRRNHVINDWKLVTDTLYDNQNLYDLLNMRAGDQNYVTEQDGMLKTERWVHDAALYSFMQIELKGSQPSVKKYNYNTLVATLTLNYLVHKLNYEPHELLNQVFTKKARTEHTVTFEVQAGTPLEYGSAIAVGWASRYDYLRIAIAMLEDWKQNNCVGQYLRETVNTSQSVRGFYPTDFRLAMATRYGRFFFTHLKGMRDRNVLYMDGYGGQALMIDFDNSRIVSVNAAHDNYNWDELVYEAIKHGDIRKE